MYFLLRIPLLCYQTNLGSVHKTVMHKSNVILHSPRLPDWNFLHPDRRAILSRATCPAFLLSVLVQSIQHRQASEKSRAIPSQFSFHQKDLYWLLCGDPAIPSPNGCVDNILSVPVIFQEPWESTVNCRRLRKKASIGERSAM